MRIAWAHWHTERVLLYTRELDCVIAHALNLQEWLPDLHGEEHKHAVHIVVIVTSV